MMRVKNNGTFIAIPPSSARADRWSRCSRNLRVSSRGQGPLWRSIVIGAYFHLSLSTTMRPEDGD